MTGIYAVAIEGVASMMNRVKDIDSNVELSAQQAINRTINWARTQSAREMQRTINFDTSYLTGRDGRLQVTQRARKGDLEAVLTGRHRATSLAQFSQTRDIGLSRREGVKVEVTPGHVKLMKRAFLMRLRAGAELTDTKYNLGLAIRLRPGERLQNKIKVMQIQENLYILYGPSVDQVFRTVAPAVAPDVEDYLEVEFNRLLQVNQRG